MEQNIGKKNGGASISSGGVSYIGGDVVGRDKITNVYYIESPKENRVSTTQSLIRDIQSVLYDDNSRLPYALTLCFDLCSLTGLQDDYSRWLEKELSGFNYQGFKAEFDNEDLFEAWMKKWASHRLIETHVKFVYQSTEDDQHHVDRLTYNKVFLAFSLAEIIRRIHSAKTEGMMEFSVELRSLGEEHFSELQTFVSKLFPEMEVPMDLKVFYHVAALEKVLNGIRSKVLSLINQARQGG